MGEAKQRRKVRAEELDWDFSSFIGGDGHIDYSRIPLDGEEDPVGYAAWIAVILALVHIDTGGPDTGRSVTGFVVASLETVERMALYYVQDCSRAWLEGTG